MGRRGGSALLLPVPLRVLIQYYRPYHEVSAARTNSDEKEKTNERERGTHMQNFHRSWRSPLEPSAKIPGSSSTGPCSTPCSSSAAGVRQHGQVKKTTEHMYCRKQEIEDRAERKRERGGGEREERRGTSFRKVRKWFVCGLSPMTSRSIPSAICRSAYRIVSVSSH